MDDSDDGDKDNDDEEYDHGTVYNDLDDSDEDDSEDSDDESRYDTFYNPFRKGCCDQTTDGTYPLKLHPLSIHRIK